MLQLEAFINSMKLTWLKRLCVSNSDWTIVAAQELPNIWSLLTYGSKKLTLERNRLTNPLYVDLLDALIKFNREYTQSYEEKKKKKIWFSDFTKYQTTMIRGWDHRGLRFIADLYNTDTGEMYSKQELTAVYGIQMTFLCYATLVRSLPRCLPKKVDVVYIRKPSIPYKIGMALNSKKISKLAYTVFVEKMATQNEVSNERLKSKWITDIGEFAEGTLQNVVSATTSTYLIYLHFRIIHRIYATNRYLFKIRTIEHDTCTFCEEPNETIFHLFWQCPKTQIFIK